MADKEEGFSEEFLNYVRKTEGFSATPYWDHKQWSIGYGSKSYKGEPPISREEGERRLFSEMSYARNEVRKNFPNLKPHQVDALSSFSYNVGTAWMTNGSGMGNLVRQGDFEGARKKMLEYNKASGRFNSGLYKRRAEEGNMLVSSGGSTGPLAAPPPPRVDATPTTSLYHGGQPNDGTSGPPAPKPPEVVTAPEPEVPYQSRIQNTDMFSDEHYTPNVASEHDFNVPQADAINPYVSEFSTPEPQADEPEMVLVDKPDRNDFVRFGDYEPMNYVPVIPPAAEPGNDEFSGYRPIGTKEAWERTQEEIKNKKSWWDRADAAAEINMTGDMLQQLWRETKGLFTYKDPEFQLNAEELSKYPIAYQDFLAGANNALDYQSRKEDVDQRLEAQRILQDHSSWHWANMGVDMVALAIPSLLTDGAFAAGALAMRANLANSAARIATYGASGAAYGVADYTLNKRAGNEPDFAVTVGLSLLGGMAFGALSHARPSTKAKVYDAADRALDKELAPNVVAKKAAEKGLDPESVTIREGVDLDTKAVTKHDITGDAHVRPTLDPDSVITVNRTSVGGRLEKAIAEFEPDMVFTRANSEMVRPFIRASKAIATRMAEIFDRQAHRLEESGKYYAVVPASKVEHLESEIGKMLDGRVIKLERKMEDAVSVAQAAKDGHKAVVLEITVPKGSRVMTSDSLKFADRAGKLILGDGKLLVNKGHAVTKTLKVGGVNYVSKAGKAVEVEVHKITHKPNTRQKGRPVIVNGHAAHAGEEVSHGDLMGYNVDAEIGGPIRSLSAGASEAEDVLHGISKQTREILGSEMAGAEAYGRLVPKFTTIRRVEGKPWYSVEGWAADWRMLPTASNALATASNDYVANLGRHLIYGGADAKFSTLNKGAVDAPQSTDEIMRLIHDKTDRAIVKDLEESFNEYVKAAIKDEHGDKTRINQRIRRFIAANGIQARDEFDQLVGRQMRGDETHLVKFDDATQEVIRKAAAKTKKHLETMLEYAADPALALGQPSGKYRPVANMKAVLEEYRKNPKDYLPRVWSSRAIQGQIVRHGKRVFYNYLLANFRSTMGDKIDDALIVSLTKRFHDTILNAKSGYDNGLDMLHGHMNIDEFIHILERNGDEPLDPELVAALKVWAKPPPEKVSSGGGHTMHKAPLDEKTAFYDPDSRQSFVMSDFIEQNATRLVRAYNRTMSGRIALAATVVRDKTGKILHDGFTSDAEIENAFKIASQVATERGVAEVDSKFHNKRLRSAFDYILGNHPESSLHKNAEDAIRGLMTVTTIARMGVSGLNQIVEHGNAIAEGGIRVVLHTPAFQKFMGAVDAARKAADERGMKLFYDLMEHDYGIGAHMQTSHTAGKGDANVLFGTQFTDEGNFQKLLNKGARATVVGSGMLPMTAATQKSLFHAMASDWVRKARKAGGDYSKLPLRYKRKLTAMGIDQPTAERLIQQLSDGKLFEMSSDSMLGRLKFVNMNSTSFDPDAFSQFAIGLRRLTTRSIQEVKYGTMHPGLDGPLMRAMLQFKSFTVSSITQQGVQRFRQLSGGTQQLVQGAKQADVAMMGDALASLAEPTTALVTQFGLALGTYYVWCNLQTIGMSDSERRKFMKEKWDDDGAKLNAMISRAGMTGWLPTFWNSGMATLQQNDWVLGSARSSGLDNTFWPASFQYVQQSLKTALGEGLTAPFSEKSEFSSKDARDMSRIFSNFWLTDMMISYAARSLLPQDKPNR